MISVIVPVYNVESYLRRCIDSIINQTYRDIEIILINDGSTDNCGAICDEYAALDGRITVIHKANGGLSDARNAGIDIATGEYLAFVDSDDFITEDACEYLLHQATTYNADIVTGTIKQYSHLSEVELFTDEAETVEQLDSEQALKELFMQKKTYTTACSKLYRKHLFSKRRYPVGLFFEDLATTYLLFNSATKVVISNKLVYWQYVRAGSITNTRYTEHHWILITINDDIVRFIEAKYPDLLPFAKMHYISCILLLANMMLRNRKDVPRNKYKEMQKKAKKILPDVLHLNYFKKGTRIHIRAFTFFHMNVYYFTYGVFKALRRMISVIY